MFQTVFRLIFSATHGVEFSSSSLELGFFVLM